MKNKKIIVTGASSGIGKAVSFLLAEQGNKVVMIARRKEELENVHNSLAGDGHEVYDADVCDESRINEVVKASYEKSGDFDGLVHAAGIHQLRPLLATNLSNIEEVLKTNIASAFIVSKAFMKKANKQQASIVLISSTAAIRGTSGASVYAASKGAILSATRSLAVELSARNIRVNALIPGVVETPMSKKFFSSLTDKQIEELTQDHLLGLGQPEDVAHSALFLLSDQAKWITGIELVVDGGLSCK